MMNCVKPLLVAATLFSASVAQAGGPVIIEEGNDELITAAEPTSRVGILPVIGALVLIGILVGSSGGDDEDPVDVKIQ